MKVIKMPCKKPLTQRVKWMVCITVFTSICTSQAGNVYEVRKSVIAGGQSAAGGGYVVNVVIGQPVVQGSAGGNYEFNSGFLRQNRDLIFTNEFESNN